MNNKWENLFGSEFEYICRLGKCFSDTEEKKSFWETIKAKKMADPAYSIYQDFPVSECATKKAMRECGEFVRNLRHPKKEESA